MWCCNCKRGYCASKLFDSLVTDSILSFTKKFSGAQTFIPRFFLGHQPRNSNEDKIFGTVVHCITLCLLKFFPQHLSFFSLVKFFSLQHLSS